MDSNLLRRDEQTKADWSIGEEVAGVTQGDVRGNGAGRKAAATLGTLLPMAGMWMAQSPSTSSIFYQ